MRLSNVAIALTVLAVFASDSRGQSQPTPQIKTEQKGNEAQPGKPEASDHNSGIQIAPLAVPPPSSDQGGDKPAAEASQNSKEATEGTEYWVYYGYKVKITDGLLVLFTMGLVVIGAFQAIYLRGTLTATTVASRAASESVAAAEAAFNKLERPYIFVSHAQKFSHDDKRAPTGIASVRYEVGNHGKTPAIIENVRAIISSGTEPDIPIRVDDQHELFVSRVVPPLYTYHPIEDAPDGIDFVASEDEIVPQLKGGEDIFLWIIVSYRGAFTKGHETSACWRYDGLTNRLIQWGHDDYNYVK